MNFFLNILFILFNIKSLNFLNFHKRSFKIVLMSIIFQTARLPVVYKARLWSFATIFHVICTIIKYAAPILTCYFYIDSHSGNTFGSESAHVVPGEILYFSSINKDGQSIVYPPDKSANLTDSLLLMVHPQYDSRNFLTSWKLNIRVPNEGAPVQPETVSVTVLFNFTVKFRKYATNTIQALGSFSQTFHNEVRSVICHGDLVLEQTEIIDFRGSFQGTDLASMDLSNYDSLSDIFSARDDVSTLFYVDWGDPYYVFDSNHTLDLELDIHVKDFTIFHSIPLVSSIETFLILFLATYLFSSLVLDNLQGFVFRHGIIKSWAIPLYQKPKKAKGMI